ncbi:MAG: sigma-54 dependent transcriptional regulator [Candidatus Neomarinimicrobiota bacterium]
MAKLIHIVDDESFMRKNIIDALASRGLKFMESEDGQTALEAIRDQRPNLVLLDINLPVMDGLTTLKQIKQIYPDLPVIIFTAHGTSERAIRAMKNGAYDYLEKPFELEEFQITVDRALEYGDLLWEVKQLRTEVSAAPWSATNEIIGRSEAMQGIFKLVGRVAATDAPVLINGESGTGKEVIADAIQRHSLRKDKAYIKVNCGALPENLLESEIFGHEKGAYTGAHSRVLGRFELANGGTLLLDEINTMPMALQVKLLRVLETGSFERVGGEKTLHSDVRIISASNRDPEKEIVAGRLREDLFYRLNVVRIGIPPLRERPEDIPLLVQYFVKKYSPDKNIVIPPETIDALQRYPWPGNIRELENAIRSQLVLARGNLLTVKGLLNFDHGPKTTPETTEVPGENFKEKIAYLEKKLIQDALNSAAGNKAQAARELGINRRLLYSKLREYSIDHD